MTSLAILCVDDERMVLSGLKDQLRRRFGAQALIEIAESGEEGLQVFDELIEDGMAVPVVISDQLMPGMTGEVFLAAIHERSPETLSILLTGQATVDAVGEAVNRARLYRYIAKPWSEQDLLLTVAEAVRAWEQARELERRQQELEATHAASLRFVPRELLALLGRDRVVDVTWGDHAMVEVGILMSDMRRFTTILEGKSPADAFAFVNQYVQLMDAAIRADGGFIVNIEGDAILALFPDGPDAAMRAAIAAHGALRHYNEGVSDPDEHVHVGTGINAGALLLGTIGGADRIQCDVVGDPVNQASRIESLTKMYGTAMLVSGAAVQRLDAPATFRLREVDRVVTKGKSVPVTLFEVIDALDPETADRRAGTRPLFEQARRAYLERRFDAALSGFKAVVADDPADGTAQLYIRRCELLLASGVEADWDGVTTLRQK